MNRRPVYFRNDFDLMKRYAQLSRADWADAYYDLYRQVFGEATDEKAVIFDAQERVANLKRQGIR